LNDPYVTRSASSFFHTAKGGNVLVLLGVLVVVVGFALRLNAMLVVTVAGLVTGFLGGLSLLDILNAFGTGFAGSRSIVIFLLVLPVIGLVERNGLQEQARRLISRLARLTTGRVLASYLFVRMITCAIGLLSIGGHAQSVRPLVAPMAEAAAVKRFGPLPEPVARRIRAFAASTDNVGSFFGGRHFRGSGRRAADHLVRRHHLQAQARTAAGGVVGDSHRHHRAAHPRWPESVDGSGGRPGHEGARIKREPNRNRY